MSAKVKPPSPSRKLAEWRAAFWQMVGHAQAHGCTCEAVYDLMEIMAEDSE